MRPGLAALFCLSLMAGSVFAQSQPPLPQQAAQPRDPIDPMVARKNAWTVGLASGQLEGLYPRFAAEIQKVLDDGDEMRIMPLLTYGSAANIDDLTYMKGVDIALTQADVLAHLSQAMPNLNRRIRYIAPLYNTEVHILARPEIRTIQDLSGKNVSFGPKDLGASITGPIVFDRLKITVTPQYLDHAMALEKLNAGEIQAIVRVVGKPAGEILKVPKESGLHFVSIPYEDASRNLFGDIYSLGELTSQDYPDLIPEGQVVDTLSVTAVLAVYNWAKGTDRYRRLERFTRYLFERFDGFLNPGFHPKWKEVNLAADVPGWTRFPAAEQKLRQMTASSRDQASASRDFNAVVLSQGAQGQQNMDVLFQQFMNWRGRRGNAVDGLPTP